MQVLVLGAGFSGKAIAQAFMAKGAEVAGTTRTQEKAETLADDASPTVRAMAIWALSRLLPAGDFRDFAARADGEPDADVRAEYEMAMKELP